MRHFKKNSRPAPRHREERSSLQPTIENMNALLTKSNIQLNRRQLEQLWRYHNLIRNRNQGRELTRIIGFEPVIIKHYVDCMVVGDLYRLPSPLMDLGSGAGFPGIPLKIRYPNLKMILAEPRPKRIEFLNEAIRALQLSETSVFEHKVVSRSFTEPVAGVISRAVEDIEKTILRTSACVPRGGQLIFMKGPNADEELQIALKRFKADYEVYFDKEYTLPHTVHQRRLIVLKRTSELDSETFR